MTYKLKSATLIEAIVAMVIIMAVFGLAMMIYVNVINSSVSARHVRIGLILKKAAEDTVASKRFFDEAFEEGGFAISKSVSKYDNVETLIRLRLEIVDGGKTFSRNQLVIQEVNEED